MTCTLSSGRTGTLIVTGMLNVIPPTVPIKLDVDGPLPIAFSVKVL